MFRCLRNVLLKGISMSQVKNKTSGLTIVLRVVTFILFFISFFGGMKYGWTAETDSTPILSALGYAVLTGFIPGSLFMATFVNRVV